MTGTERKVFQKYYPPDYDPSKIPRSKTKRNRQFVQRVMTPFNMQCNTCNEYIYKGKKFNMKRETVEGETYLGLKLFRFYFRCPNCLAEITFKTDLENCDYQNEYGATRLFEAFKVYKDEQRRQEAQEEEDKKDPMKMLEKRTMASRAEMEAMSNLEDLQETSRAKEAVNVYDFLTRTNPQMPQAERLKRQEDADEKFLRELYGKGEDGKIYRRLEDIEDTSDGDDEKPGPSTEKNVKLEPDRKPVDLKPSFAQPNPPKRNDQRSLLSKMVIVKKKTVKEEPLDDGDDHVPENSVINKDVKIEDTKPVVSKPSGLLTLAAYGSGSDSE